MFRSGAVHGTSTAGNLASPLAIARCGGASFGRPLRVHALASVAQDADTSRQLVDAARQKGPRRGPFFRHGADRVSQLPQMTLSSPRNAATSASATRNRTARE